ncbi:MAG TPA: CPBP family intramembrane glutamic endopeptidase [Longimicrobiales bacterium]|nr:CPBP family intramembrane glutamic endopeptidase [Longimicrobiales bacterium]
MTKPYLRARIRPEPPPPRPLLALAGALAWIAATIAAEWLGVWPAIGGAALLLAIIVLAFDREAARILLKLRPEHFVVGFVTGFLMAAATILIYLPLSRIAPVIAADAAGLYDAFRGLSPILAILALAPVVLGEELVWRGVVQTALMRRAGTVAGVLLSAAAYSLAQAPLGSAILMLVAFGCGLIWSLLRLATGSLIPPLVAHLVWSLVVLQWRPLVSLP